MLIEITNPQHHDYAAKTSDFEVLMDSRMFLAKTKLTEGFFKWMGAKL